MSSHEKRLDEAKKAFIRDYANPGDNSNVYLEKLDPKSEFGVVVLLDTIAFSKFPQELHLAQAIFVQECLDLCQRDAIDSEPWHGKDWVSSVSVSAFGDSIQLAVPLRRPDIQWITAFSFLERVRLAQFAAMQRGLLIRGAIAFGDYLRLRLRGGEEHRTDIVLGNAVVELGPWYEYTKAGLILLCPSVRRALARIMKHAKPKEKEAINYFFGRFPLMSRCGKDTKMHRFLNLCSHTLEFLAVAGNSLGIDDQKGFCMPMDKLRKNYSDDQEGRTSHLYNTYATIYTMKKDAENSPRQKEAEMLMANLFCRHPQVESY